METGTPRPATMCESPAPTVGPLTTALAYTRTKAQSAYAYSKENVGLFNYVATKVEAPTALAIGVIEQYGAPALSFVDGCIVKTHEVVVERPANIAASAYSGVVEKIDDTIETYLPNGDDTNYAYTYTKYTPPTAVSCVSKVYGRLPAKLIEGAKTAPATIAAVPGAAVKTVRATFTQACSETGRVMHTTVSTVGIDICRD